MTYSATAFRGVGAFSGIIGLAVIVASSVLMNQSLGYRIELGHIFGYQLGNIGTNYNRYSYGDLGYEIYPLIGISGGGIAIGIIQFLTCFLLCTARKKLSIGWSVISAILLLGVVACFAVAIYFQVYSRKILPGYGAVGLGQTGYNPSLGIQNLYYTGNGAAQSLGITDSRFGGDYLCNPTGQAYCAIFGIDMVFLLVSLFIVGCAGRYRDRLEDIDDYDQRRFNSMRHSYPLKTKI